jgi:hypothetical protein
MQKPPGEMTITDEELQGYVDGALLPGEVARIDIAVATDVLVAARVERIRRLRAPVRGAMPPVHGRPAASPQAPPAIGRLRESGLAARDGEGSRVQRWRRAAIAVVAAAAALAIVAWLRMPTADLAAQGDALVARGRLAHALDTQLTGAVAPSTPVSVGPSFRDAPGRICRGFVVRRGGVAGLACRQRGVWAVVIVRYPEGASAVDEVMPAGVVAEIDARRRGELFDAAQEEAARANDWR